MSSGRTGSDARTGGTTGPTAAAGLDLMQLLSRVRHALATEHAAALERIGISSRAFCVLCNASGEELTQVQLAERCDLDKTTMVVTVDELEAAGLARRHPSPTDRRARIITVTEAGHRAVAEGRKLVDQVHDEVLAALPDEERHAFVRGLTRLTETRLAVPAPCVQQVRRPRDRRNPGH